jgi:hypothetical protein
MNEHLHYFLISFQFAHGTGWGAASVWVSAVTNDGER